MDQTGTEILTPQFERIDEDYKCETVQDDILILEEGVFSRTGKKIGRCRYSRDIHWIWFS